MMVLVTVQLPERLLSRLRDVHEVEIVAYDSPMSRHDLLAKIEDKEGLLCTIGNSIDQELLVNAPRLKMIANYGAGIDHIDLSAVNQRKIPISNTPDAVTSSTADLTMGLILATARRMIEADKLNRSGEWIPGKLFHLLGGEVSGKTLGIIGLGRIGKAVARRAAAFEMEVLYHNRNRLSTQEEKSLSVSYMPFDRLIESSDFLSIHVPLTEQTHHLIDEPVLLRMKTSAILVNTSRGPVVDEKTLVQALRNGWIGGAGLDVYEEEPVMASGLVDLGNTVLLPHIGSATMETRTRMAEMAIENLLVGLDGRIPPNCLNPEVAGTILR